MLPFCSITMTSWSNGIRCVALCGYCAYCWKALLMPCTDTGDQLQHETTKVFGVVRVAYPNVWFPTSNPL